MAHCIEVRTHETMKRTLLALTGYLSLAIAAQTQSTAQGLCFSPNGKQLATTSHAHDPKLWDVKTGNLIAAL